MRVYGHVPTNNDEDDGNLYSNPILPPSTHAQQQQPIRSFLSLNRGGDMGALSEDCTDDYAEPQQLSSQLLAAAPGVTLGQYRAANSTSYSENIYAQAFPPAAVTAGNGTAARSNPTLKTATGAITTNHYARPQLALPSLPRTAASSSPDDSSQPFLLNYSPPRRFSPPSQPRRQRLSPPRTLNLQSVYGTTSRRGNNSSNKATIALPSAVYSTSQPDIYSPVTSVPLAHEAGGSLVSPSQSSLSSSVGDRFYARPSEQQQPPLYSKVSKRSPAVHSASLAAHSTPGTPGSRARSHSASHTDHNKGGRDMEIGTQ